MVDIVFHVGMIKTGTTFLQDIIFPKLENVNYINYRHQGLHFNLSKSKINLISDERLSGRYLVNSNGKDLFSDDRNVIAKRIKVLFPNAKIILGVREIDSMVLSMYKQYIKVGGFLSFDKWYDNYVDLDLLDFNSYIDKLNTLFNDVYVYNFKDFKNNISKVVGNICSFINVNVPVYDNVLVNKGYNDLQIKILRFLNRFVNSRYNVDGVFPECVLKINKMIVGG